MMVQIIRVGSGSAIAATRSAGRGPASIWSMRSSVISWTTARIALTRLNVNGAVIIRRNRVCSGGSVLTTAGARRVEICSMPACQCGNPGSRSFTLTRGSDSRARCSACPVMIHGVLSFQIRTRETGWLAAASRKCRGGSNGHLASRLIGKNGGVAPVLVTPGPAASCACEEVISLLGSAGPADRLSSVLNLDRQRRADPGRAPHGVLLGGVGCGLHEHDDAVLVPLVEDIRRGRDALACRNASVLVHRDSHQCLSCPRPPDRD